MFYSLALVGLSLFHSCVIVVVFFISSIFICEIQRCWRSQLVQYVSLFGSFRARSTPKASSEEHFFSTEDCDVILKPLFHSLSFGTEFEM